MSVVRVLGSILLLLVPVAAGAAGLLDRYGNLALRGDLSGAAELFARADSSWTQAERALAARFKARFVDGEEDTAPSGATPFVREVIRTYHAYWRAALLGEDGAAAEARLADTLRRIPPPAGAAPCGTEEDPQEWLAAALERDGMHALTGRTWPLLDLMIWAREDTTSWIVTLTDAVLPVEVVFVRDFLASGWTEWATFGRSSTGGWATRERLFCLADSYDLESESFRVSYLAHEARHFADYPRFPALLQTDLEYRAKLTEIALADSTLPGLLGHFTAAAAFDEGAPHSWAAACVVRDLAAALGRPAPEGAAAAPWAEVPADSVRAASRALLEAHTARLRAAGADTCRALVGPSS